MGLERGPPHLLPRRKALGYGKENVAGGAISRVPLPLATGFDMVSAASQEGSYFIQPLTGEFSRMIVSDRSGPVEIRAAGAPQSSSMRRT